MGFMEEKDSMNIEAIIKRLLLPQRVIQKAQIISCLFDQIEKTITENKNIDKIVSVIFIATKYEETFISLSRIIKETFETFPDIKKNSYFRDERRYLLFENHIIKTLGFQLFFYTPFVLIEEYKRKENIPIDVFELSLIISNDILTKKFFCLQDIKSLSAASLNVSFIFCGYLYKEGTWIGKEGEVFKALETNDQKKIDLCDDICTFYDKGSLERY